MSLLPQDQLEQITNALVPTIVTAVVAKMQGQALPQQDEDSSSSKTEEIVSYEQKELEEERVKLLKSKPDIVIIKGTKRTRWQDNVAVRLERVNEALEKYTKYSKSSGGNL